MEEALLNAMYHGNLEISREALDQLRSQLDDSLLDRLVEQRCQDPGIRRRRVFVVIRVTATEVGFVVRDEGSGFNRMLLNADADANPFENGRQRGLTLIHTLMDEVKYNKVGNELVLQKRYSVHPLRTKPRTS